MSDISDVLLTLAKTVAGVIYPTLTYDEIDEKWDTQELWDLAKGKSAVGSDVRVYPGWPTSNSLDDDLSAGISHVTVFPLAQERNTTRYPEREHVTAPASDPTLSLTISGPSVRQTDPFFDIPGILYDAQNWDEQLNTECFSITVGGTVSVPQNIALRINGKFYVYGIQASDTLQSIAATLAGMVGVDIQDTSAAGAVLQLGPTARLQAARIGTTGTIAKEIRRQERLIQITVWANAPDKRDAIGSVVDVALAEMRFLQMADGFGARIIYKNSVVIDQQQKANLYRRDLNYLVEYATTVSKQRAAVIAPSIDFKELVITF